MKALIFGLGSIGSRHARNLAALRPGVNLIYADPRADCIDGTPYGVWYDDWRFCLRNNPDADIAIIASPTSEHLTHMAEFIWSYRLRAVYIEKPLCLPAELYNAEVAAHYATGKPYVVGHQYRFAVPDAIRNSGFERLRFYARDDLIGRYGPDCLGVMAAHPIDTALWILGPARAVHMATDGTAVWGTIEHERGTSEHDYDISVGPRESYVSAWSSVQMYTWHFPANNQMYIDALAAWLRWVEVGKQDDRTCTLAEGLVVVDVMSRVEVIEHA